MAAQIEAEAKATAAYTDRKAFSAAVMAAFGLYQRRTANWARADHLPALYRCSNDRSSGSWGDVYRS